MGAVESRYDRLRRIERTLVSWVPEDQSRLGKELRRRLVAAKTTVELLDVLAITAEALFELEQLRLGQVQRLEFISELLQATEMVVI